MTTTFVPLYLRDTACESPHVATKKKPVMAHEADADDTPPVAVPKVVPAAPGFDVVKWFYVLGASQFAVLSVVLASYFSIQNKLDAHEKDINALKAWIKKPGEFPATKGIVKPDSTAQTVPMPDPSTTSNAPIIASVAPAPSPTPMLSAVPRSVHTLPPPVCVSPKTKHRFACEDASACYPDSAYNPDFFAGLKKSAGADSITVCDPK